MLGDRSMNLTPKYLTPKVAAKIYGVHPDFFRKHLWEHRTIINRRTHLYPVVELDRFFGGAVATRKRRAQASHSAPTNS